ncbi:MAG: hypothetical protein O2819_04865 [Planctomycetota bacterium]|nr:hypothetical protein [Planctomycetota bacterium]MDA1105980.1 hypothetical protein [Planctomycetota bacterium]
MASVHSTAIIEGAVTLGAKNVVYPGACLGFAPQHTADDPIIAEIRDFAAASKRGWCTLRASKLRRLLVLFLRADAAR